MPRNALYPASSHEARYPDPRPLKPLSRPLSCYLPSRWTSAPILGNDSLVILMGSCVSILRHQPLSRRDMGLASTEMSCPGFSAVRCGAVHRPESYVCPLFSILLRSSARQGSAREGATIGAGERPLSSRIPKSSLRSVLLALRLYTTQMAKLQSPRYGSTQRLGALGIQAACPFITLIQFTARAMYEWSVSTRHY